MSEMQRRLEEATLSGGRHKSEAQRKIIDLEQQISKLQAQLEQTSVILN